jgi:hypothetical protein
MEKSKLSEIEKGEMGEEKRQEHAHHFLDIVKGIVHKDLSWKASQIRTLLWCFKAVV